MVKFGGQNPQNSKKQGGHGKPCKCISKDSSMLCDTIQWKLPISVSTESFDWGFLYLLIGKVGGTKNGRWVKEF